jgi:RNA binding exosome subunit
MAKFQPGNGGRPRGAKNRLTGDFIGALAKEFEEHGADAIKIVRTERPHEFLKIIASLMPKELEISDNRLQDISDDELELFISFAQRQLASDRARVIEGTVGSIIDGKKETEG